MQLTSIHHVALKCWDVEALAGFYELVFGLGVESRFEDAFGLRSIWLRFGDVRLMLERSEVGGATNRAFADDPIGMHLLAFMIRPEERENWRRTLDEAGCPIAHETEHTLYVQDPEGNRIGLSSYPL